LVLSVLINQNIPWDQTCLFIPLITSQHGVPLTNNSKMSPRPAGRALWEANGPALGRVFGDLSREKLPVIARSEATRRSQLREPSRRRLNEQVEVFGELSRAAMAGFPPWPPVITRFIRVIQFL
jgi:hypothetical protein